MRAQALKKTLPSIPPASGKRSSPFESVPIGARVPVGPPAKPQPAIGCVPGAC